MNFAFSEIFEYKYDQSFFYRITFCMVWKRFRHFKFFKSFFEPTVFSSVISRKITLRESRFRNDCEAGILARCGLERCDVMNGAMTRRNIHKTQTHRATLVRNIDISAPALFARRFFGPPVAPMLLNSHVRKAGATASGRKKRRKKRR